MQLLGHVLVDESHRQAWSTRPDVVARMNPANPADSSYQQAAEALRAAGFAVSAHEAGPITADTLAAADVVVLPHCSQDEWEATTGAGSPRYEPAEIAALESFVRAGGGLVILGEEEQAKYGNSLAEIAARFGVTIRTTTTQDPVHRHHEVSTWVLARPQPQSASDLLAGVQDICFYRAGALQVAPDAADDAFVVASTHDTASPADAPLLVAVRADRGRVVVAADSDLFGDDSIEELDHRALWLNLVTWAMTGRGATDTSAREDAVTSDPAWLALTSAVADLRGITASDGSIAPDDRESAGVLVAGITSAISALAPSFPHQRDQLEATVRDFDRWAASGFGKPDFLDSLLLFHPEQQRTDGAAHLAVFPMYTQNGNPDRNVEAVVTRTVWPEWIADLESSGYDNAAFVPIEFVGFTAGYDTHSAVLFPETVATRETPQFTWGGIFCDREAARFRRVCGEAAAILRLSLPPDAEMLLSDQSLAQQTYVLWDLVHDRTHSHGDLPFDPFMIKQRMPYWMYGLEELRCDLSTFRETPRLEQRGIALARHVRYAILFDRLFRFPTTGNRVRNYDGLGGQILFAWLHKHGVLNWTDNILTLDWPAVPGAVTELCVAIEGLYRDGIDRSRMGHWMAGHEFVSSLVPPHPGSVWARGAAHLPVEPKDAVDAVLPDEFPLSVFYEALRKKLADTIESARGITGATA